MPDLLVSEDKIAMDDYDRRRSEGLKLPEDDVALKCVHCMLAECPALPLAGALLGGIPRRAACAGEAAPLTPFFPHPLPTRTAGRAMSGCATRRPCPAPP